jgi:hypothetical protein
MTEGPMLKAEEQMELAVLRKHGDEHPEAGADDVARAEHGAALPAWRRGGGDA